MQLSKRLLAITVFMFGILGLNPALAQDPVPWAGGTDCYVNKCIGDKEEFLFLVGRGAIYKGSTQQLFIIEDGLSQSQRRYQLVQIRNAGDERNYGLIVEILNVIKADSLVSHGVNIGAARSNTIYALVMAAGECARGSISNIVRTWNRHFRDRAITSTVTVKLQEIQDAVGCDALDILS